MALHFVLLRLSLEGKKNLGIPGRADPRSLGNVLQQVYLLKLLCLEFFVSIASKKRIWQRLGYLISSSLT
jgi:hypothetical protein